MDHLRHARRPEAEQRHLFLHIVMADPLIAAAMEGAQELALPDWLIVSGALYNSVWNYLTGRPSGYGVKDIDLFYFDRSDLSWEAEDTVIRRGAAQFARLRRPVEIRNQARVHLWFEQHFGSRREPLASSTESLEHFASRTHAVGLRFDHAGAPELFAPFGLEDIFAFRLTPNHRHDNSATHHAKARRARQMWPEVTIVDW